MVLKDEETPTYGSTNGPCSTTDVSLLGETCAQSVVCNGGTQDKDDTNKHAWSHDVDNHDARALTNFQRFSYGVGHVLNDLTASMWFSYLLIFLQKVDQFKNILAGNLMLIGQVSDALCTPFVGFESDQTRGIWKLGKRKSWHFVGTFCVMASFVFLFSECITCSDAPSEAQFVYYIPFVVIFQFGWASTQISHLSFSSDITPYKQERVALQSIRNAFTVMANVAVYGLLTLLFYVDEHTETGGSNDDISPADAPKFRNLAIICLGIGTVFNAIFYFGTKEHVPERPLTGVVTPSGTNTVQKSAFSRSLMSWRCWLRQPQFYQIALLYMSTRLYINVSQVYFPMYLTETVGLAKNSIAIFPLVSYLSSFVTSLMASFINRLLGRKTTYVVAVGIGAASCVWMYFIGMKSNQVYGCAVLMGSAGSLLLITSLSMTSDLIGANTESGAFVFGAMSFTDKLSNGVAVLLIQYFHPCVNCCPLCVPYYRHIQTMVPGGALVVGFIALLMLLPQNIGVRNKRPDKDIDQLPSTYDQPTPTNPSNDRSYKDDDHLEETCVNRVTRCHSSASKRSTPVPPSCDAVTHCAEVYAQYDDIRRPSFMADTFDDDDNDDNDEERPLMGSLNTRPNDVGRYVDR